jgi:hypothetical protein
MREEYLERQGQLILFRIITGTAHSRVREATYWGFHHLFLYQSEHETG